MSSARKSSSKTRLLAGGNPQIAKGDGNAPVQAYISAIPDGWKRDVARRLDELVSAAVPAARKGVRWNSPMYGIQGKGWFVSFHIFTNYVKVTFFKGTSLKPIPPGGQAKEARWIDIRGEVFDEKQIVRWMRQAAKIPGWGDSA